MSTPTVQELSDRIESQKSQLMQVRAENEMLHQVVSTEKQEVAEWKARFDKLLLIAVRQ